jgi:hypothetical protein
MDSWERTTEDSIGLLRHIADVDVPSHILYVGASILLCRAISMADAGWLQPKLWLLVTCHTRFHFAL